MRVRILLIFGVLLLSGCARDYMDGALMQEDMDSYKHPVEMEKNGDVFVFFNATMNPALQVEATAVYSEDRGYELKGFYPVFAASTLDKDASMKQGVCYTEGPKPIGRLYFDRMRCMIKVKRDFREEFKNFKIFTANKDTGWKIFPVVSISDMSSEDGEWDHNKFQNDFTYRLEMLNKFGQTVDQINQSWQNIVKSQYAGSVEMEDNVQQLKADRSSARWMRERENYIKTVGNEIVLPNGDIVVSDLSLDDMVKKLSKNPMITPGQKLASGLNDLVAGTPQAMIFGAGTALIHGIVAMSVDSQWQTSVARGIVKRKDMEKYFIYHSLRERQLYSEMMNMYKKR